MNQIAVVSIDVQHDFVDPTKHKEVGSLSKAFCVCGLKKLLAHAGLKGWRIIHVGTLHDDETTLPLHQQRRGSTLYCKRGSIGAKFVVEPQEGEELIYKTWYSAFTKTNLEEKLLGIKEIIFAGVTTDCCVLQSVFEADLLCFKSYLPLQAVSASSIDGFVAGLITIAKSAADIIDLRVLLNGANLEQSTIDINDIEECAKAWFENQQTSLQARINVAD